MDGVLEELVDEGKVRVSSSVPAGLLIGWPGGGRTSLPSVATG